MDCYTILYSDQETLTLLRLSAISGIDVRILYPGKSDSIISDQASQSYFTPLLKAGASIYSYKDGFMHAKIVLVDDKIATIGTANMDVRSFELNYEIISVLYESETVHDIKRDFEDDFKHSTEIKWNAFQREVSKTNIRVFYEAHFSFTISNQCTIDCFFLYLSLSFSLHTILKQVIIRCITL